MAEHPVAGVDYPARWRDFLAWFPDDAHCLAYLELLRWGSGFACPRCGGQSAWHRGDGLRRCSDCRHTTSVTAGTIFHLTRTPLTTWFAAVWYVTNQKNGVSALGLQRILGIDYSTAWTWLHKLRRAMVRPGRDQLCGTVEVDETYVGGPEKGVFGRETETKSIVVVAAEENGHGIGRIRLARVHDVSAGSLIPFVEEVIQPGTKVHTDGWPGYDGLRAKGYRHKVTNIKRSEKLAHELMPRVHRVAALLKRWILGTHQGSVSDKHLPYYLDEFTFRFNRRHSKARGLLFYRLLQQAVQADPAPYAAIVGEDAP
jgi:transposase-like protein